MSASEDGFTLRRNSTERILHANAIAQSRATILPGTQRIHFYGRNIGKAALKQLGVPLACTGEVEQHVHADPQGRLFTHSHH